MPSCRSFRKLDKYSSRNRCAMRGRQLNDNVRNLLEAKISHSRSTRQKSSFIIEFRRWFVEFWNSVIKRLKGVFLDSRNLHSPRSLTSRITNMDPDRENAFWREGRLRTGNCEKKLPIKMKRKNSNVKNRIENRDTLSQSKNGPYPHAQTLPMYPVDCKTCQWPKTQHRSVKGISNFTGTETTDEEYFALYKKPSRNEETDKSTERNFSNSSGDFVVEPIEAILSRYQTRKSSKSTIDRRLDSSVEEIEVSDERKSKQEPKVSRSVTDPDRISVESAEDGKWIETTCFGSVWYSKSELNIAPKRSNVTRTRNQVSRIPRLRHSPEKRNPESCHKKNETRPSSVLE